MPHKPPALRGGHPFVAQAPVWAAKRCPTPCCHAAHLTVWPCWADRVNSPTYRPGRLPPAAYPTRTPYTKPPSRLRLPIQVCCLASVSLINLIDMSLAESSEARKSRSGCASTVIAAIIIAVIVWVLVRPGVFTIQPIGALPEGVTFIYHSRGSEIPLFSSPDGLCLKAQQSVTLLCRAAALSAVSGLTDRIIVRLPYSHWAYLLSTDGQEFTQ